MRVELGRSGIPRLHLSNFIPSNFPLIGPVRDLTVRGHTYSVGLNSTQGVIQRSMFKQGRTASVFYYLAPVNHDVGFVEENLARRAQ